jgi:hypothetical protein
MDDRVLARELEEVRGELGSPHSGPCRAWGPHLRAAWLLIALRRNDEAVRAATDAQRAFHTALAATGRAYRGCVLWEACAAEAVAHLAAGRWAAAEGCTRSALRDFGEEPANSFLHAVALRAQGRPGPGGTRHLPAGAAPFDAVAYARARLSPGRPRRPSAEAVAAG